MCAFCIYALKHVFVCTNVSPKCAQMFPMCTNVTPVCTSIPPPMLMCIAPFICVSNISLFPHIVCFLTIRVFQNICVCLTASSVIPPPKCLQVGCPNNCPQSQFSISGCTNLNHPNISFHLGCEGTKENMTCVFQIYILLTYFSQKSGQQ